MTDRFERDKIPAGFDVKPPNKLGDSESAQTQVDLALRDPRTLSARERTYLRAQKRAMEISGGFEDIRSSLIARPGSDEGLIRTCSESITDLGELVKDLNTASGKSVSPFAELLNDQGKKLEQTRALTRPTQVPKELRTSSSAKSNLEEPESEISQLSRAISRVKAVSQMMSRGMTGLNPKTIEEELKDLNRKLEASKAVNRDEIVEGTSANKATGRKSSVKVTNKPAALGMHQILDTGATRTYDKIDGGLIIGSETLSGGTKREYDRFNLVSKDNPEEGNRLEASIQTETLPGGYIREYISIEDSDTPVKISKVRLPYGITVNYAYGKSPDSNSLQTYVYSVKGSRRGKPFNIIEEGSLDITNAKNLGDIKYEKELKEEGYLLVYENGQVVIHHDDGRYTVLSSAGDHIEHKSYREEVSLASMPPLFMSQGDGTHLNLVGKMHENVSPDGTLNITDVPDSITTINSKSDVTERPFIES